MRVSEDGISWGIRLGHTSASGTAVVNSFQASNNENSEEICSARPCRPAGYPALTSDTRACAPPDPLAHPLAQPPAHNARAHRNESLTGTAKAPTSQQRAGAHNAGKGRTASLRNSSAVCSPSRKQ